MAQKNFTQMPTKKLIALLETASDEDKTCIEEVLNQRDALAPTTDPVEATVSTELSAEEAAAIAAAEGKDASATDDKPKTSHKASKKLTDQEREAIVTELRATAVNHRCQVVPFNSLEWVDGVVLNIIEEKRNSKVLFAIKTDDGRRLVKAHDSALIKILDEVVEPVKTVRGRSKKVELDENGEPIVKEATHWTDEEAKAASEEFVANVGKTVSFPKTGTLGIAIKDEKGEQVVETGRIVSLVPNKRTKTVLYRIELNQPDAPENAPKKYSHKVTSTKGLVLAEVLDEVGQKINEAFINRRNHVPAEPAVKMTPAEAIEAAKASVTKAEETLAKAQAVLEKRKAKLEELLATYNNSENGDGTEGTEGTEGAESEETTDDLM